MARYVITFIHEQAFAQTKLKVEMLCLLVKQEKQGMAK